MPQFIIEGERVSSCEETINAADLKAAVSEFRKRYPDYGIDSINDRAVMYFCEQCGLPIFVDDDYHTDEVGDIAICRPCGDKLPAEAFAKAESDE